MRKILALLVMSCVVFLLSCAPTPFVARNLTGPPIRNCNDATGHIPKAAPFVLGGQCTCTPTQGHYTRCLEENTIVHNMRYDDFLALYSSKGIKTDLDHRGCNNRCEFGPHVVFGGKCMATPTPGTLNYEKVVSGDQSLTEGDKGDEEL